MKAKGTLAMAIMMALASEANLRTENNPREYAPPKKPKKIIPKGCNEYHFTKSGTQVSENCTYIHFSCMASNSKNAIKKFNNFIKQKTRT